MTMIRLALVCALFHLAVFGAGRLYSMIEKPQPPTGRAADLILALICAFGAWGICEVFP